MPKAARASTSSRKKRSSLNGNGNKPPRASTSKTTVEDADEVDARFAAFQAEHGASQDEDDAGAVESRDAAASEDATGGRPFEGAGEDDVELDDVELDERELLKRTTLPDHLLPRALVSGKKVKQPGLVYLSRLPPGMGPAQVRHLMSAYGEIGRIYLELADKEKGASTRSSCSRRLAVRPVSLTLVKIGFPQASSASRRKAATRRTTSRRAGSSSWTSASPGPLPRCSTRSRSGRTNGGRTTSGR